MIRCARFIVATPIRSVCDENARVLAKQGLLRFLALGTRRGSPGIPTEQTRLFPLIGLLAYASSRFLSWYHAEAFRFALNPLFDHWVRRKLQPGDHVISSYGYANACFRRARERGGRTFLDGGNSHPEQLWSIMSEEHRRWAWRQPPIATHHYRRAVAMMSDVDFVLTPSRFVSDSFLKHGFRAEQLISNVYPLDLSCFTPPPAPRPRDRPLTIISTGSLSLRKGTPYLLEAFRIVLRSEPDARLFLTEQVADSAKAVLARYSDLPINWAPSLPHGQLAERLRSADVFVLPSLEDGFGRTVTEALACGLPAVVTTNTGASDFVRSGENGTVVAIRDPHAIAEAIMKWGENRRSTRGQSVPFDRSIFSFDYFATRFLDQLSLHGLI